MDYGQTLYGNKLDGQPVETCSGNQAHTYNNQPGWPAGCKADLKEVGLFLLTIQEAKQ